MGGAPSSGAVVTARFGSVNRIVGATALLILALTVPPVHGDAHLLLVTGVGGESAYVERFHSWAVRVFDAALEAGVSRENVVYLGERPEMDAERISRRSTGENVLAEMKALVERSKPDDDVWIVLFGHGSGSSGPPRFNLPGRDLVADEYAAALGPLADRRIVFVNASSASGGFLAPLSKEGRVVITATRSGAEGNESLFGGWFAAAFEGAAGDQNKDGRTSALEAFRYAEREVERYYRQAGLLRTENALLDDDGDGMGSPEPAGVEAAKEGASSDGRLASLLFLGQDTSSPITPASRELVARRERIARRIDELRLQRDTLDEEVYLRELEDLMVELALVDRELASDEGPVDDGRSQPNGSGEPDR